MVQRLKKDFVKARKNFQLSLKRKDKRACKAFHKVMVKIHEKLLILGH